MPPQNMPSYEFLLGQFRARRRLYILGAGASTGDAPFGQSFMIGPAVDYVREAGGFPAILPEQSELNRRIIDIATQLPVSRFFPEREFRPGTPEFPYREMLQRLPGFYARLLLKHTLSTARFSRRQSDNYRLFELFRSGTILNYNLDGLATEICSRFHRVLAVHGIIQLGYGSPRAVEIIAAVRELRPGDGCFAIGLGVQMSSRSRESWVSLRGWVRIRTLHIVIPAEAGTHSSASWNFQVIATTYPTIIRPCRGTLDPGLAPGRRPKRR
jgi:hypothetical protein